MSDARASLGCPFPFCPVCRPGSSPTAALRRDLQKALEAEGHGGQGVLA